MRTDYCGELTRENLGKEVKLYGWVNKARDLGGVVFFDLRDISGLVQVVVRPDSPLYETATQLRAEYCLEVSGKVILRENPNLNIKTGEIEINPSNIVILNKSLPLPIDAKSNDEMKLKYRYLDLRRLELQEIFKTKARIVSVVRRYLEENQFIDCETPILAKSTPEGARDYLVPSRIFKGEFFALPQSPQVMKQLLMVAGFDRYYQIAKCFRDEDLRADRQPEFSQIDIETSFLNQDEILTILEGMFKVLWKEILNLDLETPFKRLEWKDAMRLYGSDKPDTRFKMELEHYNELFSKVDSPLFNEKNIVGIRLIDGNREFSRKKIDSLIEYAKKYGAENLLYLKKTDGQIGGSIIKLLTDDMINELALKENELLLLTSHKNYLKACTIMGALRVKLASDLGLYSDKDYDFKWVVNFPLFELADDGSITSSHHPFTRPLDSDKDKILSNPLDVYSAAYDLVCQGYEVGGGSLRIYDSEVQQNVFKTLNISEEQQKEKFGYLFDAMTYGCPPHGGCAFGLERLTMILVHSTNIRDVVLFPKTTSSQDLMLDSPNPVDLSQLEEVSIKINQ